MEIAIQNSGINKLFYLAIILIFAYNIIKLKRNSYIIGNMVRKFLPANRKYADYEVLDLI